VHVSGSRRLALGVALAVAVIVLATMFVGGVVHNVELIGRLRGSSPGWLALCAAGELLAYAGLVGAYRAFAASSNGPRLPTGLAVRVIGVSFGAFAATTAIGGLSFDFWALREAGEPTRRASARIIGLETLRWATLAIAACFAGVLSLAGVGRRMPWFVPGAWLLATVSCFAAARWISGRDRDLSGPLAARAGRLGSLLGSGLEVAVGGLRLIRRLVGEERRLRVLAVAGSSLFWTGELICAWGALRAFHVTVGPVALLLAYATACLAMILPLPLGGAGGVEAAMTAGFALAGAPLGSALLAAVAFRLFSFWLPALIALPAVAGARSLRGQLRELRSDRSGILGADAA
jgi:uncharacterized membrane protein YbhN (UPF0104 family)